MGWLKELDKKELEIRKELEWKIKKKPWINL